MNILDQLRERLCRGADPTLAASPETFTLTQVWVGIVPEDGHMNWLNWLRFVVLMEGLLVIVVDLHHLSFSIS